jgi:hypothetical protein
LKGKLDEVIVSMRVNIIKGILQKAYQ